LEFDPEYPRYPRTLGEYIRKWRMEQGLLIRELAGRVGVTDDTVINWEIRDKIPQAKMIREKLREGIPGWGGFFRPKKQTSA
jgi:transcriptional regulator with XRE-family HTH domain